MEKVPRAAMQDIDKKKFLVPSDITGKSFLLLKTMVLTIFPYGFLSAHLFPVLFAFFKGPATIFGISKHFYDNIFLKLLVAQFMYIIRKRTQLTPEKAMFLFVKKLLPATR